MIDITFEGIDISCNDVQWKKHFSASNRRFCDNSTFISDTHPSKQYPPRYVTFEGIDISFNDLQWKKQLYGSDWIFGERTTLFNWYLSLKQYDGSFSTKSGIVTCS